MGFWVSMACSSEIEAGSPRLEHRHLLADANHLLPRSPCDGRTPPLPRERFSPVVARRHADIEKNVSEATEVYGTGLPTRDSAPGLRFSFQRFSTFVVGSEVSPSRAASRCGFRCEPQHMPPRRIKKMKAIPTASGIQFSTKRFQGPFLSPFTRCCVGVRSLGAAVTRW